MQASWQLQSHTVNSALMLSRSGYVVELFLYNVDCSYAGGQLENDINIQIHTFSAFYNASPISLKNELLSGLRLYVPLLHTVLKSIFHIPEKVREHYLVWKKREDDLMPSSILRETLRIMEGKEYKALIGIEKRGLVWAGQISQLLKIPYIYHSLELYTSYHPEFMKTSQAKRLRIAENKYHKEASATIIQDERRADVLFNENKVDKKNIIYVPISILGQTYRQKSSYLQKKFNIKKDKIIIMQFGLIWQNRFNLELTNLAQNFPEDWTLVFHGYGQSTTIEKILAMDKKKKVILSLDLVPIGKLQELIASAHIGLVLYHSYPANDYLTAYSSEKMALQLQCGLPIIAFDYPGYEILEKNRCGVLIKKLDDIPQAIEHILTCYDEFSSNAYECFEEHYEFSRNYKKVTDFLETFK